MKPETIVAELRRVYKSDPVGDLAAQLVQEGVTEEALAAALMLPCARTIIDPLRVELHNKFRDIARSGWTDNRYGVHIEY
jgi:hypothetical protein